MSPESMFPEEIENCTASTAEVVFTYPAVKASCAVGVETQFDVLAIKCLTNVVELGLNKCKKPAVLSSLLTPIS